MRAREWLFLFITFSAPGAADPAPPTAEQIYRLMLQNLDATVPAGGVRYATLRDWLVAALVGHTERGMTTACSFKIVRSDNVPDAVRLVRGTKLWECRVGVHLPARGSGVERRAVPLYIGITYDKRAVVPGYLVPAP